MKRFTTALTLFVPLMSCAPATENISTRPDAQAFIECGVMEAENARLMSLSQKDFDQDMEGGWRIVANQENCKSVAGYLIEDYIAFHDIEPGSGTYILYWHTGQMHAYAGDTPRAIDFMKLTYDNLPPKDASYEWSLYAKGTVAFLNKNREGLEDSITRLAKIPVDPEKVKAIKAFQAENPNVSFPEGFPEKPLNLIALEGFLACFDRPYSEAFGSECKL